MPKVTGLLETVLYVDDLARARDFYRDRLGFTLMVDAERLLAFDLGPGQALLLFARGATLEPLAVPGGTIPPHDGSGPAHAAFRIADADLSAWHAHLQDAGIEIESSVEWPAGGTSLYFRDPDGHCLELATPGLWANYPAEA